MGSSCDFCNRENFSERIFYETDLFYWVLGRKPIRPGHTLVIVKRHIQAFDELSGLESSALIFDMRQWLPKLLKTYSATGYNLAANYSLVAGQTIPHFHMHIVPRGQNESGQEDSVRARLYRDAPEVERPRLEPKSIQEQIAKLTKVD